MAPAIAARHVFTLGVCANSLPQPSDSRGSGSVDSALRLTSHLTDRVSTAPSEQGNCRVSEAETENDELVSNLVQRMRRRTSELHTAAERSGIVAALIMEQVSRSRYALFLRDSLPAYQAMELALRHHRGRPNFDGLAQPSLYRCAERIVADLVDLEGLGLGRASAAFGLRQAVCRQGRVGGPFRYADRSLLYALPRRSVWRPNVGATYYDTLRPGFPSDCFF